MSLLLLPSVNQSDASHGFDSAYLCCVCGQVLAFHPAFSADEVCPECDSLLWCFRRNRPNEVFLEALPHRTPSVEDINRLTQTLLSSDDPPHVIVDLSGLDLITSALVAMLVLLNKRIRAAQGTLQLCGLNEVVREVFYRFKLDGIFEIVELETDDAA